MTRLTLDEIYILSLKEELPEGSVAYMTKEDAYNSLKKWTGQDFGYDADKWEQWVDDNGLPLMNIQPQTASH